MTIQPRYIPPPRPSTPGIPDNSMPPDDAPMIYYTAMMLGADTADRIRKRFMDNCNQRRWSHIINAEVKAKK